MSDYPKPTPHDPIVEVFPDLFIVYGSIGLPPPAMRISRNMTIVRQGTDLTLINAVRLVPDELEALEKLGDVRHIVRLGHHHGLDDKFYVDRYRANFWSSGRADRYDEPIATHILEAGGELPLKDAELFDFQLATISETALLLHQHGGILVTCDSIQNWSDWRYCTLPARLLMTIMGFSKTTLIGPLWLKGATPDGLSLKPDFDRLLALQFDHLIAAHGQFRKGGARQAVQAAVNKTFANELAGQENAAPSAGARFS